MDSDYIAPDIVRTRSLRAQGALDASATGWFVVAVLGQWMFAYYILGFYGSSAMNGNLEAWNEVLPHGYSSGDHVNNISVALHLLVAFILSFLGPLQLVPGIRNRFPIFHHWNGRLYFLTALLGSVSGLIMVWTKGSAMGIVGDISISINAVLIIACAIMAVRYARQRQIDIHRRWALRLFLVVSGVWFFRVGLMGWLVLNQGPVGFDPETFRGPFLIILGFGQYVIPLLILEAYFYAQKESNRAGKLFVAGSLAVLTLVMAVGIFAATMGMWLPRL